MQIKVAIVDDDDGIRSSLATLIRRAAAFQLTGDYPTPKPPSMRFRATHPMLCSWTSTCRGMKGMEVCPPVEIATARRAIFDAHGLRGQRFLVRFAQGGGKRLPAQAHRSSARLLEAIRDVHAGGAPMTPQLARRVVQFFTRPAEKSLARFSVDYR